EDPPHVHERLAVDRGRDAVGLRVVGAVGRRVVGGVARVAGRVGRVARDGGVRFGVPVVSGVTGRVSRPTSTLFSFWTFQLKLVLVKPCSYFHMRRPTVSFVGASLGDSFHMTDASTGSSGCATVVSAPPATPTASSGSTHF